jgi:hypothetical protein
MVIATPLVPTGIRRQNICHVAYFVPGWMTGRVGVDTTNPDGAAIRHDASVGHRDAAGQPWSTTPSPRRGTGPRLRLPSLLWIHPQLQLTVFSDPEPECVKFPDRRRSQEAQGITNEVVVLEAGPKLSLASTA